VGADPLVTTILKPDVTRRLVYLPEGPWYDHWTNKKYIGGTAISVEAPLDVVPMFVRGGAIIPSGPALNYVGEKPVDPITFAIYPDNNGLASTSLYEDDGLSPAYKRGAFRRTAVSARRGLRGIVVSVAAPQGSYNPGPRKFSFVMKADDRRFKEVTIADDGTAREVEIREH